MAKRKQIREKPKKKVKEKFEFEVGEIVIYSSGVYDKLKGLECEVLSRSRDKKGENKRDWYNVRFQDGKEFLLLLAGSVSKGKRDEVESIETEKELDSKLEQ